MRNLSVLSDKSHSLEIASPFMQNTSNKISAIAFNNSFNRFYVLFQSGLIVAYNDYEALSPQYSTLMKFEGIWEDWFSLDFVVTTSTLVAISREGSIATIEEDLSTGTPKELDQVGVIEGGIAAAKWHPDYSSLIIITRNNTLLCMSNSWEVINEIEVPAILPLSKVDLSWKGDGDLFAVVSTDDLDKITRIRVYDKELTLTATGRNVGEGAAAVLKGVNPTLTFACNGSYIAYHQEKPGVGHQVGFVEKNGLSHNSFDLRTPPIMGASGEWKVDSIQGDVTSLLLAVTWRLPSQNSAEYGCIQIYYRENYYWYLKQQMIEKSLQFLQFDPENTMRFFCQEKNSSLRIVSLNWMVSSSNTRDGTVSMIDGQQLQSTPLGYHSVPPPMSFYKDPLITFDASITAGSPRHVSFWERNKASELSGTCLLLDQSGSVLLALNNDRGKMIAKSSLIAPQLLLDSEPRALAIAQTTTFREALVIVRGNENEVSVVLLGTKSANHTVQIPKENAIELHSSNETLAKADDVIVILDLSISSVAEGGKLDYTLSGVSVVTDIPGNVAHLSLIAHAQKQSSETTTSLSSFVFGLANIHSGDFEIVRLSANREFEEKVVIYSYESDITPEIVTTIPEACLYFTVVKYKRANTHSEQLDHSDDGEAHDSDEENEVHHASDRAEYVVMALSTKNRLYCNEILLFTGISSFIYNHSYELMMCMTMGNKPQLHFILLTSLINLLELSNDDMETNQEKLISLECCEPRPCERGTRLLLSVNNDSKVILQMPRGNLEIIEPRLLLIMKVQRYLLDEHDLFEAFLILRKQKIDFNYLFDYSPKLFFIALPSFIERCLASKLTSSVASSSAQHQNNFAEYLSLLITSIEPQDVTKTKYSLFNFLQLGHEVITAEKQQFIDENDFINDNKINYICNKIREILLEKLQSMSNQATVIHHFINPILCTYAKPKPPLLVEAIQFIKDHCIVKGGGQASSASSSETKHYLTNHLLMNSIKYLSFLVDGDKLFQSSLSICDFLMSKLIARQCGMDPKVYLPLIESFEAIGRNHSMNSSFYYLMNYKIQIYLKNSMKSIDNFLLLLQTAFHEQYEAHTANTTSELVSSESEGKPSTVETGLEELLIEIEERLIKEISDIIEKENSLYSVLSKLVPIELDIILSSEKYQNIIKATLRSYQIILQFFNKIRLLYANKCCKEMNHTTAIHYYLSIQPPAFTKAIDTALSQSNWILALTLAGRYAALAALNGGAVVDENYTPNKIAQDIVYNFQQNQEYFSLQHSITSYSSSASSSSSLATAGFGGGAQLLHHGDHFAHKLLAATATGSGLKNGDTANRFSSGTNPLKQMSDNSVTDKSILAARISIEYCQDVESAVSILTTAYHWTDAINTAIQHQRFDLLDEIFTGGRTAVKELIRYLNLKAQRLPEIISQLNEFWKNPIERIQNLVKEDTILQQALKQEQFNEEEYAEKEEGGGGGGNNNDFETSSEFTAITKYSLQSIRSGRSNKSSKSLISNASSLLSGSHSSVSILSQVSDKYSQSGGSWKNDGGEKSFSIQGLDHSLLSRGKLSDESYTAISSGNTYYKRDLKPRHQKRIDKQKAKGTYYDRTEGEQGDDSSATSGEESSYQRKQKYHQKKREQQQQSAKDPYETKKEHQLCEELLEYTHLKGIIQIANELIQLLQLATTSSTASSSSLDRRLLLDLMKALQDLIELLQKQQLLYAPNYPMIWLLKKNYKSLLYYQNYQIYIENRIRKQLQIIKFHSPQQFQELFTSLPGAPGVSGATTSSSMTMEEWVALYMKSSTVLLNLLPSEEVEDVALLSRNWWQLCLEGIQGYYQMCKVIHIPSSI